MKRITDIKELKPGDRIVSIQNLNIVTLQYICVNPNHEDLSIVLELNTGDANSRFLNGGLQEYEWYLYNNTETEWREVAVMRMEKLKQEIENTKAFLNECK